MKIVLNKCYGGYSLSLEAILWLRERGYKPAIDERVVGEVFSNGVERPSYQDVYFAGEYSRSDALLIECVEQLQHKANTVYSNLMVVEIPDGVQYEILDNDGIETACEIGRYW